MRRVSFALVLTVLLLSFGLTSAQTWTVDNTGLWTDGTDTFLNAGVPFTITLSLEYSGVEQAGWSTPFRFYGTGSVNLVGPGTHTVDPNFEALWGLFTAELEESWDGDLTTGNTTMGPGDYYNFSGADITGLGAGTYDDIMAFSFQIPDPGTDFSVLGTFCIDSADMDNNTYDWLFAPALPFYGPYCWDVAKQPNAPPVIDNCPTADISQDFDQTFTVDFDATDPEGDPITFELLSGPGSIDASTGVWEFNATCGDLGSHTIEVCASDGANPCPTPNVCTFTITVTNSAPSIAGDCGVDMILGTGASKTRSFTADANNIGDNITWSVSVAPGGDVTATVVDGLVEVTAAPTADDAVDHTVTVTATDCAGDAASCTFDVDIISEVPFVVQIEKVHDQLQGHHSYVDVSIAEGSEVLQGFDFLIGYDLSALTFVGAEGAGALFDIPGAYEWEYFTYRYSWNGNCGNGCPSGLLRVVGMAEQNDGAHHPNLAPYTGTLFTLDFLVTNDRNFGCMYAPVYFYWMDCGDNTLAFNYRSETMFDVRTAMASGVYNYNGDPAELPYANYFELTSMDPVTFPTAFGADAVEDNNCLDGFEGKPAPVPFADFLNGGVDIVCPEDIDDRGDVNMNGVSNEIGDAVVFTNYFIYGMAAFTVAPEGQIAATEINGDGIPLTVADLVYLIRVIVGDALPLPKVAPNLELNVFPGEVVSVDGEVGAIHFVLEGNADVTLADGARDMELIKHFDGQNTNVLVYAIAQASAQGDIIKTDSKVLEVEAADYQGNAYKADVKPMTFGLRNFPNPFNPVTTIELSLPTAADYSISIYNVAGQRVISEAGHSEAGVVTYEWDASNQASGIYFYKVEAGNFSATKKMVLLK